MIKSKRSKWAISAIVLGTVIIIIMAFLLYNQLTALQAGYVAIDRERALLSQARNSYQQLKLIESRAAEMRRYLAGLKNALPNDPAEDLLINDISDIVTAAGGELLEVQFAERVPQKKYVEMPVTIALTANFPGILDLLHHLQNGPRLLRIEEFTISVSDQTLPFIKAEITATAFYTD